MNLSLRLRLFEGLLLVLVLLAGCNPPRERLEQFNGLYEQGKLRDAEVFCSEKTEDYASPSRETLLWALQLAAVQRTGKDYQQSNLWFDRCEDMMKIFDPQLRQTDVIGTTLVNDNIIPYRGQVYDGIMVNTYKALNFMALRDDDLARVELNRALERQTRAKDQFNAEIQKKKDELNKSKTINFDKTTNNSEFQGKLKEAYPELYEFEAYPDFVNPFSTYLAAVFFTIMGDAGKSRDLFKECAGMMPQNAYIQQDFTIADQWLTQNTAPEPTVWVFFENGLGPVKDEIRIDLPLFFFTDKVYYAGIALPKLVKRWAAADSLSIQSGNVAWPTQIVGDMDRVIQTEFSKEYPWIIIRAIIGMGAKTGTQVALLQQDESSNSLAAAAVALYSWMTTAADVRIWSSLPKNFQSARLPMPASGSLTIRTPQGYSYPVTIRPCRYAIVYIKIVSVAHVPTIEVITY